MPGNYQEHLITRRVVAAVGLLVFAFVLLRTAWVCDDAYIAFRTVDNFVHGYGLRWNVDERVWSFTNPLWVLFVSGVYYFTHEMYFTSIFLSIGLAIITLIVLNRGLSRSLAITALIFGVFTFSKAFTDYSTSGLENVMTHLLLAIFLVIWLTGDMNRRRLFWLSLVASLATLNRMDTILLVFPALALAWWQVRSWISVRTVLAGFLPFILWEGFALIYYGFPFPNTYYAKTHTGIPSGELLFQGFLYFLDSLQIDPITLLTIFVGLVSAWVIRSARVLAVALGIALFFLYTLKVGGDFMSGRFFTAPLVCAVAILTQLPINTSGWRALVPIGLVLTIGFASPRAPIFSSESYGTTGEGGINPRGIADERGWYYQGTGLLKVKRGTVYPDHEWSHKGLETRYRGTTITYDGCVGFMGFFAGPKIHIVDMFALTEPLLSRLPREDIMGWRIGHFSRMYPAGYDRTNDPGANTIIDSGMHTYFGNLCTITRGPVWSLSRLKEIIKFNMGIYDSLLMQYAYPPMASATYDQVNHPKPLNTPWDAPGTFRLNKSGIRITLPKMSHAPRIECSFDHNDHYLVVFRQAGEEVGYISLERKFIEKGGLRIDTLAVPTETHLRGYDVIDVRGFFGDGMYAIGHLTLMDEPAER